MKQIGIPKGHLPAEPSQKHRCPLGIEYTFLPAINTCMFEFS